jgi:hypothetical protein
MKRLLYILPILILTSCDIEVPYNKIPCQYDFSELHAEVNEFGLWSHGACPDGFRLKSKYDSTDVNCSDWKIQLGIDSCVSIFYNEEYVINLAQLVFNDTNNNSIDNIEFELSQCHLQQGQRKFIYQISKNDISRGNYGILLKSENSKIIKEISEGYTGSPENKIITLMLDSTPSNPFSIAKKFWIENNEYMQVELIVENIDSKICKKIEYTYAFEK